MGRWATLGLLITAVICGCSKHEAPPTAAAPPKPIAPKVLLRLHTVGWTAISENTNAATLKAISAATNNSPAVWDEWVTRVSTAATNLFPTTNSDSKEFVSVLRPMWDDLRLNESLLQITALPDKSVEWTLAVQVSNDRAVYWQTNFTRMMSTFTGHSAFTKPKSNGVTSAEFKIVREGNWVVAGLAAGKLGELEKITEMIKKTGRPAATNSDWLELTADLPQLAETFPLFAPFGKLPKIDGAIIGKEGTLRTRATLSFSQPRKWSLTPWQIPTNLIREPLISFTASRSLVGELQNYHWFNQLKLQPEPDQMFAWAQSDVAFQTYFAMPVKNGDKSMDVLISQWPLLTTNLTQRGLGKWEWDTNHIEIYWRGFPALQPLVHQIQETNSPRGFLFAGVFPPAASKTLIPPELIEQVHKHTNLVYYDWEITQNRVRNWKELSQFRTFFLESSIPETNYTAQTWVDTIAPELGNAVTEITVQSPTQLNLYRNSYLGLTGIELATLAVWLDNPGFPSWAKPPPRPPRDPNTQPAPRLAPAQPTIPGPNPGAPQPGKP